MSSLEHIANLFADSAKCVLMTLQKLLHVLYSLRGFLFLQRVNHIVLVINRRPFTCHLILILKGVSVTSCNWLSSFMVVYHFMG